MPTCHLPCSFSPPSLPLSLPVPLSSLSLSCPSLSPPRAPRRLHQQTDKQRIIWAYKILFLDVLFPVDVPRMIFVDSDQVVRTDLGELYHMDLKVCWGWWRHGAGGCMGLVAACAAVSE